MDKLKLTKAEEKRFQTGVLTWLVPFKKFIIVFRQAILRLSLNGGEVELWRSKFTDFTCICCGTCCLIDLKRNSHMKQVCVCSKKRGPGAELNLVLGCVLHFVKCCKMHLDTQNA